MRAIEVGLRYLVDCGLKYVFGIPAGSINALYDSLLDMPELTPIIAKHEISAGYMATAYTRISGLPSLCVASSGPGATNLVTAAANALKEKLPVIFITGSVPVSKIGKGGAQELNAVPIFESVTKYNRAIHDANELPRILAEAWNIAISGVPGPIHLSIPIDIQMTNITSEQPLTIEKPLPSSVSPDVIANVVDHILKVGNKGAILLGYGAASARTQIIELAEFTGWPVATTPRGKGTFPEDHPLSLGVYGLSGHDKAMDKLNGNTHELLLVIGSSLGELATCNWDSRLVADRTFIQIDVDPAEIGKNYTPALGIVGDACTITKDVIMELKEYVEFFPSSLHTDPNHVWQKFDRKSPYSTDFLEWNTKVAIEQIAACAPDYARFYIDIGELMTYSIQNIMLTADQKFDIDINFGGMGSGIGGAIGAQLAEPERPIICITGDGCFFMHGFEILTAKQYKLPILFVVINNARLGMVYHGHMLQYKRCLEDFSQTRTDISKVAEALGVKTVQIRSLADLQPEHVVQWFTHNEPVVVEVVVEGNEIPPMGGRVKFLENAIY
jgi:acetolactate synthase-1/2/3 large subunit